MEKEIKNNDFCSAAGFIKNIYYIAAQDVEEITPNNDGVSVQLGSSAFWKNMSGMGEATCTGEPVEGGAWQYTVEAKVAGRGAVPPRYLQKLTAGRWLLKLVDYTGKEWLVGESECPLRCAVTDTATSEATGETLYTFRFVGVQRTAAMQIA